MSAKCLQNESMSTQLTDLEKGDLQDEEFKIDLDAWCEPNQIKLKVIIGNYITHHDKEHKKL